MEEPSFDKENWGSDGDGPRYRGQTKDTIRSGVGKHVWPHGGQGLFKYQGVYHAGVKQGDGRFTVAQFSQYRGAFDARGEMTGRGTKVWATGARYEGEFVQGEMHGDGVWESGDGDEAYTGRFSDNKRHGRGVATWRKSGAVFRGEYVAHQVRLLVYGRASPPGAPNPNPLIDMHPGAPLARLELRIVRPRPLTSRHINPKPPCFPAPRQRHLPRPQRPAPGGIASPHLASLERPSLPLRPLTSRHANPFHRRRQVGAWPA